MFSIGVPMRPRRSKYSLPHFIDLLDRRAQVKFRGFGFEAEGSGLAGILAVVIMLVICIALLN